MLQQGPVNLYKLSLWKFCLVLILTALITRAEKTFGQVSNPADTSRISISRPKSELDKPIIYKAADSIWFNLKKNRVYLYKNASIEYGDMNLTAHFIEIDLNKKGKGL